MSPSARPSPLRLLHLLAFILLAGLPLGVHAEGKTVRILTIGNSFSRDALGFLPEIAASRGNKVIMATANMPGAPMSLHTKAIDAYEKDPMDPKGKIYGESSVQLFSTDPDAPQPPPYTKTEKASLKDLLTYQKWDYVTIQQVSKESFKPESYEPFAKQLVDYIHKYAPQAEILIHQTWAYREDHGFFNKGDGFTQLKMYEGLKSAYQQLSEHYKLRLVPVGDAFQTARGTEMWTFVKDANFDYKNPAEGTLPKELNSLNSGWNWGTNAETGLKQFRYDGIHANTAGRYLGAVTFYEFLFGDSAENVTFVPKGLTPEQATSLRAIAHQVLAAKPALTAAP